MRMTIFFKVKPATSCHLQYEPIPSEGLTDEWTLENSVRVTTSTKCTYFCVVGFGPGGYAGIQHVSDTHKVSFLTTLSDKIFGGQNFSADKIFGTNSNFRQFCLPKFCPIR